MKYTRFFYFGRSRKTDLSSDNVKRDEEGRIITPLYSDFFVNAAERLICTNSMYADFRRELSDTVEAYSPREPLHIRVYESASSEKEAREMLLIGVRNYLGRLEKMERRALTQQLLLFSGFLAVGIVILILFNTMFPNAVRWQLVLVESVSTVFICQFAGFLAFELADRIKSIRRLYQLRGAEFSFRQWE